MRKIDFSKKDTNKDAKINEKIWHRRIGRELSDMSYNKGKKSENRVPLHS